MEPCTWFGSRKRSDLNWPLRWKARKPSRPSVRAAESAPLTPAFQPSFSDCGRALAKRSSSLSSRSWFFADSSERGMNTSLDAHGALTALSVKMRVSMSLG